MVPHHFFAVPRNGPLLRETRCTGGRSAGRFLVDEDNASPAPLERAGGRLIQVCPQDFLARWHLGICIVVPLPSIEGLT